MRTAIVSFSAGVLLAALAPALPSAYWLLLGVPALSLRLGWPPRLVIFLSRRFSAHWRLPLYALLGALWVLAMGHWQLRHTLPESLSGRDFLVTGRIVGLPDSDTRRERVTLQVEQIRDAEGRVLPQGALPRRIQVSWYGGPPLASGERWQWQLRLRPPRGFVNPAGFDYQLWLMRQGIDATGYVRTEEGNPPQRQARPQGLWAGRGTLGYWRQSARLWLEQQPGIEHTGLLQALLLGDRSGLDSLQWAWLQRTGTNHLIAISGLHVGFVALLGFSLGSLLGRGLNLVCHRLPAGAVGQVMALLLASLYSALAGFALPTQRALIMVLAVQLFLLNRRRLSPSSAWLLALGGVLLLDPLAGFDVGFWLSFTAVGVLLWSFSGRRRTGNTPGRERPGQALWRAQWVIFLGLLVPLTLLTQSATLLAPLANLAAIPLVTFAVVPWLLGAAFSALFWPGLSGALLWVADTGLALLTLWLQWLDQLAGDRLQLTPARHWPSLLMAAVAAGLLLLPERFPGRSLGYWALPLALLLPGPPPPPLRLAALDVGQGLAMVVQTPNHSLVFDTGPRFSERLDAGSAIVAPYLRHRGSRQLDALVVSHRHSDHSGGVSGLLEQYPSHQLWLGEALPELERDGKNCREPQQWQWDGVRFQFLFAGLPANPNSNNHSCVLLIEHAGRQILLTGDIEREVEWRLIGAELLPSNIDLLQIPHHGSDSSSTPEFVQHLAPARAIASNAHRNRFGHPTDTVVARYREQGTRVLNTAQLGALEFEWDREGQLTERHYRRHQQRFWYRH